MENSEVVSGKNIRTKSQLLNEFSSHVKDFSLKFKPTVVPYTPPANAKYKLPHKINIEDNKVEIVDEVAIEATISDSFNSETISIDHPVIPVNILPPCTDTIIPSVLPPVNAKYKLPKKIIIEKQFTETEE